MQVKVINKNFEDLYLSLIEDNPVIVIRIEDYKRLEQKYGVADFAFQAPIHYEEYQKMADAYKMEIDKVKAAVPAESLTEDIKVEKALKLVKEKAVIK